MDQDEKLIQLKLAELLIKIHPKADIHEVRKTAKGNYVLYATYDGSYENYSEEYNLKSDMALQICKLIKL